MRKVVSVFAAVIIVLVGVLVLLREAEPVVETSLEVSEALSIDTAGFAFASEPRTFTFPADHGPHPDFRTEWWYFTGNLEAAGGRHFGYQLTFFRTALRADSSVRHDSTWSSRQLYMAHFAVSDAAGGRFKSFERFSRAAAGLAGAQAVPFRVWLEDWSASGRTADSLRLVARDEGLSIRLHLKRLKPIVLQGEGGFDRKGPEAGDASYYYSMTRMATTGTLRIEDDSFDVGGLSWMDREWSTSALAPNQVGWDWFALQLEDGRDVMYYRLRERDGMTSPYSGGSIVDSEGQVHRLSADDVHLEPEAYWRSEATGRRYPVEWSFQVPSHDLDLSLTPYLRNQELDHTVAYWEGAVRVAGSETGSGFVEMTGYGAEESSNLFTR